LFIRKGNLIRIFGIFMKRNNFLKLRPIFSLLLISFLFIFAGCSGGGGGGGSSTGNGGIIKIGWDPNTESDLAGYRVYYGTRSDNAFTTSSDVGMASRDGDLVVYTITNLNKGQEYCIALTAYNTSNYESGLSNLWGDVCGNAW
jgi:Fibronectin type III domain